MLTNSFTGTCKVLSVMFLTCCYEAISRLNHVSEALPISIDLLPGNHFWDQQTSRGGAGIVLIFYYSSFYLVISTNTLKLHVFDIKKQFWLATWKRCFISSFTGQGEEKFRVSNQYLHGFIFYLDHPPRASYSLDYSVSPGIMQTGVGCCHIVKEKKMDRWAKMRKLWRQRRGDRRAV